MHEIEKNTLPASFMDDHDRLALAEIESFVKMYGRDSRLVRLMFALRRLRNRVLRDTLQKWVYRAPRVCADKLNILLHLRGGFGDACGAYLLIRALRSKLPDAVLYVYTDTPGAARAFLDGEKNVVFLDQKTKWRAYDLAAEVCHSVKFTHVDRKRFEEKAPDFLPVLDRACERQCEFAFFLEDNYLLEDALGRFLFHRGLQRLDLQSYLSGLDFDAKAYPLLPAELTAASRLKRFGLDGKKYITFHDGINGEVRLSGGQRPLKCWPRSRWRELAVLIKKTYPGVLLVQLGGPNSRRFDFTDVCLLGKTEWKDLPSLLEHALVHVDGDSGLVQLSRYLSVRCAVLFGPTDAHYFGLSKNMNLGADVCGRCMWVKGTCWHTACVLGHESCRNMEEVTVERVFDAVRTLFRAQKISL